MHKVPKCALPGLGPSDIPSQILPHISVTFQLEQNEPEHSIMDVVKPFRRQQQHISVTFQKNGTNLKIRSWTS